MSALRTAGRGGALRQQTVPTTRMPSQFPPRSSGMGRGNGPPNREPAPLIGTGRGDRGKVLERSELTRSVLRRRDATNRHGQARKREVLDWFSSPARLEALEQLKISTGGGDKETRGIGGIPFGWRDFGEGLQQLPENHWASPFVREVVRSIEMNPGLEGRVKEEILDRTLTELSRLSMNDGRFQDAEQ